MTKKITSKTAKSAAKKATKAPSKKAPKLPKVDPKAVEIGNLCVHALALFTNAVIKTRTENAVEMFIPLTLAVGKKTEALEITYRVALDIMKVDGCESMTLSELGAALFKDLCNTLRESDEIVDIVGKPFNAITKFEILTDYKNKCVYKDSTLTFVKAGQSKTKKSSSV